MHFSLFLRDNSSTLKRKTAGSPKCLYPLFQIHNIISQDTEMLKCVQLFGLNFTLGATLEPPVGYKFPIAAMHNGSLCNKRIMITASKDTYLSRRLVGQGPR
jgi:hypothetical protein